MNDNISDMANISNSKSNNNNGSRMYGVIDGISYCNIKKDNELNVRIADRNIPSEALQPQYSMRPVSTKYAHLPIVDRRVKPDVAKHHYEPYSVSTIFNPGTAQAPWSGFATNIDVYSLLRNQFFAIQDCPQAKYIPGTNSDLYKSYLPSKYVEQPFPELFTEPKLGLFNPNNCNLPQHLFNTDTRNERQNLK